MSPVLKATDLIPPECQHQEVNVYSIVLDEIGNDTGLFLRVCTRCFLMLFGVWVTQRD